jgi:pre-mRNA-splicing factor CDC5/CEF1
MPSADRPAAAAAAGTPYGPTGARGGVGATPSATPGATPLRDALGLNDADSLGAAGGARAERARQAMLKGELRAGLSQLPKPQNEYEVAVPELPQDEEMGGRLAGAAGALPVLRVRPRPTCLSRRRLALALTTFQTTTAATTRPAGEAQMEEDAAETKARRQREEAERRAAEERKKSQALQRGLPRPAALAALGDGRAAAPGAGLRERAEALLQRELVAVLQHDADKYPVKRSKKDKGGHAPACLCRPPLPAFAAARAVGAVPPRRRARL